VRALASTVSLGWRRRLTPVTDGWLDAGGTLATQHGGPNPQGTSVLPTARAGVATAWEPQALTLEVTAGLAPAADRYTGALSPVVDAALGVRWRASPTWSVNAAASAAARTDGETKLAAWSLRAIWNARERLAFELGVIGRLQRERDPGLPSYVDGGLVAAVTWSSLPVPR
jgi:hypothetical protein